MRKIKLHIHTYIHTYIRTYIHVGPQSDLRLRDGGLSAIKQMAKEYEENPPKSPEDDFWDDVDMGMEVTDNGFTDQEKDFLKYVYGEVCIYMYVCERESVCVCVCVCTFEICARRGMHMCVCVCVFVRVEVTDNGFTDEEKDFLKYVYGEVCIYMHLCVCVRMCVYI